MQDRTTEHVSNGRAGSMEAGHGQTIGLNGSSKSVASTHPMLIRSSTDHFSPSSLLLPPTTPMGPTAPGGGMMRREPFDALLRGDESLANKVQTVIISRKLFNYYIQNCVLFRTIIVSNEYVFEEKYFNLNLIYIRINKHLAEKSSF